MKQFGFTLLLLFSLAGFCAEIVSEPSPYPNQLVESKQKFESLERQVSLSFLRYKPIYFAYAEATSKVQFSFKSPIIEKIPFYFAYSQIIFWKLNEDSKPFLDGNYNPEFLYQFVIDDRTLKSIDYGFLEHQSNGKAGEASRSFNQTYLKANLEFESQNWIVTASGKLAFKFDYDSTNRDIEKYIGPAEFRISFIQLFSSMIDKSELSIMAHPGGKYGQDWSMGGYELGYSFRLGGVKAVPSFYLQYYNGYGETLLNYSEKEDRVRIGLLF